MRAFFIACLFVLLARFSLALSFGFYTVKVKSELRKIMHKKSVAEGTIAVARMHRQLFEAYDKVLASTNVSGIKHVVPHLAPLAANSSGAVFRRNLLDDMDA